MPWRFDPEHSQVEWASRYLGISLIKGSFDDVKAEVDIEDSDPAKWSISADIDPRSVTSPGFARRIEALQGENFLHAEQFPELRFRSKRIEGSADSLRVSGDLTLHGITREVELTAEIQGTEIDPWGNERVGLEVTGQISRGDYDMKFNQVLGSGNLLVSDKVKLRLDISAVKKA